MGTLEIIERIKKAIDSNDPFEMENALKSVYVEKNLSELIPVLICALKDEKHFRQEDIVTLFQKAKDPRTIDVLSATTFKKFEHLDYDETFGLARKCTWALADIGTEMSKAALEEISKSDNALIAKYAQKRLDNWENELGRKR